MNKITSSKLAKSKKNNRNILIVSLILISISVLLVGWAYLSYAKETDGKPFTDISSEVKNNGQEAIVEVASEPYVFAEYDGIVDKYYLVFDNNDIMYILYLTPDKAKELSKKDIKENPIKVKGIAKPIPDDVRSIAINAYNEWSEEQFLTNENFETYLGVLYLDQTTYESNVEIKIVFSIISLILGTIVLAIYLLNNRRAKQIINSFSEEEWKKIESELESNTTKNYEKQKVYLTDNYLVTTESWNNIIPYDKIIWIYPYHLRQYGVLTTKSIVVVTSDRKRYHIANINNFSKKENKAFDEIAKEIIDKNKDIVVGYTKENKKLMKEKYNIK